MLESRTKQSTRGENSAPGRLTFTTVRVRYFVQNGWCVEFKTSEVTAFRGEERLASNYLDYFLLDVSSLRLQYKIMMLKILVYLYLNGKEYSLRDDYPTVFSRGRIASSRCPLQ